MKQFDYCSTDIAPLNGVRLNRQARNGARFLSGESVGAWNVVFKPFLRVTHWFERHHGLFTQRGCTNDRLWFKKLHVNCMNNRANSTNIGHAWIRKCMSTGISGICVS